MPIFTSIDSKQKLVIARCTGVLLDSDFQSAFHAIKTDPEYKFSFNELWDIRGADNLQLSFQDWQGLGGTEVKFKTREAIVVATEIQYRMANKYAQIGKAAMLDVRVFYDYDEAQLWIAKRN